MYHIKNIIEFFSLLSGPALVYIGWRALDQIEIMKRDTDIRINREQTSAAVEQMRIFSDKIIPSMDKYHEKLKLLGIALSGFPLNEFTEAEWNSDANREKYFNKIASKFDNNPELKKESIYILNAIEALAVNFIGKEESVAKEQIAFSSLSNVFCKFIEEHSFLYCMLREEDKSVKVFENTIKLYRIWNLRRKTCK